MSKQTRAVSDTEFAILNVLWDRGSSTVREIVEAVYKEHTHSLHASVKSLLERLAAKGYVSCERRGAAHFFLATVERESFVAQELQLLADSNFGGSLAPLLLTLVDNVKLSGKDRKTIQRIIDKID
ncbi:MAG: BlaI/MecI/CopY family transcriptional regulator [Pirellulaceae bacterium]|jgi:predicted transcriptional regulator|nr:BlaI/MecI/CopY family transcriptional regulator [Pirellulaceae bacterium]